MDQIHRHQYFLKVNRVPLDQLYLYIPCSSLDFKSSSESDGFLQQTNAFYTNKEKSTNLLCKK